MENDMLNAMSYDFTGKVAMVTGSSRGIGAAMIEAFGQLGAHCVVNYIDDPKDQNKAEAHAVAAKLKNARIIQADVGNPAQVNAMFDQIHKELGGLDILVNNSAILIDRTIKKMTIEEWESVLRVNLTGTFNCLQAGARILRAGGRVVNMASVSGQAGFFGQANYAASKAGVIALTKVASRELARQKITVNAIAPGFIDAGLSKGMPPDVAENFKKQVPLGRFGKIDEIVQPVLFLCSPQAGYITGQVINVNGGVWMA
jgi:3-oxoacyl-[acyl-carrier protein] reductase